MSDVPKTGGKLFIVDNSDESWKGLKYLQDWTEIASAFDIATGYFEIGALLALDGQWQKLGKIRILMGNEVSAIKAALVHAETDFEKRFGFRRSHPDAWTVAVQASKENPCLQAVDYFLWALQRFYEIKWNAATKEPQLDSKTGFVIREDRFLNALWPQVGEIHDLHFGPAHGTFFTVKNPLKLEERFPPPVKKKKP